MQLLQKTISQTKSKSIRAAVHIFLHDIKRERELSAKTQSKIMDYIKVLDRRINETGKRAGKRVLNAEYRGKVDFLTDKSEIVVSKDVRTRICVNKLEVK